MNMQLNSMTTGNMIQPQAQGSGIETASASAAALAKASVEARYIMAMRQPRDLNAVRLRILDSCRRSGFAETARYSKPIAGSKIVGPSIRFAEEVARCMGNIQVETAIVHEDARQRILRVTVTDLEANLTYPTDILVEKQVERSRVREGQSVIGQRMNSYGKPVFIVEATEDELLVKAAALTSKAVRTAVLRLLPGDILDDAMAQVEQTLKKQDEQDPAAARKKLCDAFYSVGVQPADLVEFLGHPLEQSTPAEMGELRLIFSALREGEITWSRVMEPRREKSKPATPPPATPPPAKQSEAQPATPPTAALTAPSFESPVVDVQIELDEQQSRKSSRADAMKQKLMNS